MGSLSAGAAADKKAVASGIVAAAAAKSEVDAATARINAVETGLAAKISAATQQAVEAKQMAEESKASAAEANAATAADVADGLEFVKQNLARLQDASKDAAAAQADIASSVAAAADAANKNDLIALEGKVIGLQSAVTAALEKIHQESVRSLESKANKLNAHIKMTQTEVTGIRDLVTSVVATHEEATETPAVAEEEVAGSE